MTNQSELTKREAVEIYGLEDPRTRPRKLTPWQISYNTAVSQTIRELGLRVGVIVEHDGEKFVVIAVRMDRIGLHHMGDLSKYRNPPAVYWLKEQKVFCTPLTVIYSPCAGFGHVQCIRYNSSSIVGSKNRDLMEAVAAKLGPAESYKNEHGLFWMMSAARRIIAELESTATQQTERHVDPEPVEPLKTFCAECGNPFIDDDRWRRSKRCQACRIHDASFGMGPRHCVSCGSMFTPRDKGAKLWKCGVCTNTQ